MEVINMFGTTYSEDDKLKPCPFCQGKAWLQHIEYPEDTWYNPQCSECKAGWMESYETKDEAINAWNERK